MRHTRIALLAATATVAATASLAGAAGPKAPAPTTVITDPTGDARVLGSGYDLVAVTMVTKGKKVGKAYRPTDLLVTLTMAGPPTTQKGAALTVSMKTTACGNGSFMYSYTPGATLGNGDLFVSGCGTTTPGTSGLSEILSDVVPVVSGHTVTWDLPIAELGQDLPIGSTFSGFSASSDLNEPVFGIIGTGIFAGLASIDTASGSGTYKLK